MVQAGAENAEEGWEGRICVRDLRRRRPEEDLALHSDRTLLLRFPTQGLHTGGTTYLVSFPSFHEIGLLRGEHLEAVGGNVPVVEMMSSG